MIGKLFGRRSKPDPRAQFVQAMRERLPPRTVAQQARLLEAYPPGRMHERCMCCGSAKMVVHFSTIWRHTMRLCEECLVMLHGVLLDKEREQEG